MDDGTRAMLAYASKLTESPAMADESDVAKLREAGWSDRAVWQIMALTSFFNFTGRMEAASGLPPDEIPARAKFAEARGA